MAESQNGDQITLPLPWGQSITARGSMVILVLLVLAGGYLTYLWNAERAHEHDEIVKAVNYQACLQKLNIFVTTAKDPSSVRLNIMPSELWACLPKFLSEEQQEQRKQREAGR